MLLLLHLGIAFTSIVCTTISLFRPSHAKLHTSHALIAATLVSGTWLVIATHSPLLQSCLSGITYTTATVGASYIARRRLAHQQI